MAAHRTNSGRRLRETCTADWHCAIWPRAWGALHSHDGRNCPHKTQEFGQTCKTLAQQPRFPVSFQMLRGSATTTVPTRSVRTDSSPKNDRCTSGNGTGPGRRGMFAVSAGTALEQASAGVTWSWLPNRLTTRVPRVRREVQQGTLRNTKLRQQPDRTFLSDTNGGADPSGSPFPCWTPAVCPLLNPRAVPHSSTHGYAGHGMREGHGASKQGAGNQEDPRPGDRAA
jgi:hypothetical protein|mmetsp:Transcript_25070/g.42935  ORF Transcript_25070/g.42935 Transcript_25070/m.42935 type:complete len:227 (+) Transcript_25070:197-877(+)